jgi:hypothetical protein
MGVPATLIGILFFAGMSRLKILLEDRTLGHSWADRASLV